MQLSALLNVSVTEVWACTQIQTCWLAHVRLNLHPPALNAGAQCSLCIVVRPHLLALLAGAPHSLCVIVKPQLAALLAGSTMHAGIGRPGLVHHW